jgi:hypothetical protein
MDSVSLPQIAGALFCAALLGIILRRYSRAAKYQSAPGPPKSWVPFVGNAFQLLSTDKPFPCKLVDWAKEYGEFYVLEAFGTKTFVVSSAAVWKEV